MPPSPTRPASTSRCSPRARRDRVTLAPKFAAAGVTVIDNSSAWRMDPDVPLVVAEVNPHTLDNLPKGIVANPNCTTMGGDAGAEAAAPRRRPEATRREHVPGDLGRRTRRCRRVRRAGAQGRRRRGGTHVRRRRGRLPRAVEVRAADRVQRAAARGRARRRRLATRPTRSRSSATRAARSSRSPTLPVSVTCVRVPVFTGHSLSINAEFERADLARRGDRDPGWRCPASSCPTSRRRCRPPASDPSYVGRIRRDPTVEHGLALFVSTDNLRKGAALNAVQIAELLAAR